MVSIKRDSVKVCTTVSWTVSLGSIPNFANKIKKESKIFSYNGSYGSPSRSKYQFNSDKDRLNFIIYFYLN